MGQELSKEEARRRYDALTKELTTRASRFSRVLPEKTMTVDRFVQVVLMNVWRTPKLLNCTPHSIFMAAMGAAKLGLEPDAVLGHCSLIPFDDEATLVIGYRGMVWLAWRDAKIMIDAAPVHEKDYFEFERGTERRLIHRPVFGFDDPGRLIGAWATGTFPDGRIECEVLSGLQVHRIKASAKGAGRSDSPWKVHEDQMWRKSPVRALFDLLPISSSVVGTLAAIESGEAIPEGVDDFFSSAAAMEAAKSGDDGKGSLAKATAEVKEASKQLAEPAQKMMLDTSTASEEPAQRNSNVEQVAQAAAAEKPKVRKKSEVMRSIEESASNASADVWTIVEQRCGIKLSPEKSQRGVPMLALTVEQLVYIETVLKETVG